jgi:hypothetical protein
MTALITDNCTLKVIIAALQIRHLSLQASKIEQRELMVLETAADVLTHAAFAKASTNQTWIFPHG